MAIDDIISTSGAPKNRPGGSRRSAARAIAFWTMTLVAGGGAAVLLKRYVDRHQGSGPALSQIAVAAIDLPLATALRREHVKLVAWPATSRPAGTFAKIDDLVGRVLIAKTVQAEPILASKLAARESGTGLAALIPENMRALAVKVDDVVGVAGFIHPDDRVDVIATMRPENSEPTAKVILQNVKVLAVGRQVEVEAKNRGKALPTTVATLLVTPEQSEKLALASVQGKLLLTLRSFTDAAEVDTAGIAPSMLVGDGRKPTPPVESKPRPVGRPVKREEKVAQAPAKPSSNVEILRGDRFEERKFESKE